MLEREREVNRVWKKYWKTEMEQVKGEVEGDICSEREGGGERMKG